MNYTDLRESFMALVNHSDCTPQLADKFIEFGTSRVERKLRTALQRKTVEIDRTPEGDFPIPSDLLSFIRVYDDKGIIPHVSPSECVRGFYVKVNTLHVYGSSDTISIHYHAGFPREAQDDYLPQASAIPEVIIYAALVFAETHFQGEKTREYENMFLTLVQEIQQLSNELDLSGSPKMRNPYEGYI